jgi:Xaa-Pro dipeptidase
LKRELETKASQRRIDRARALMGKHGIGALLIEPGASLVYFTGVQWWRSERLTAAVLPPPPMIS